MTSTDGAEANLPSRRTPDRSGALAVCGLAGALVCGLLPIANWLAPGDSMAEKLAREGIWWCIGVGVLLWLRFGERLPLSSIGFRRPTWRSVAVAVLAAVLVVVIMVLQFSFIIPLLHLNPEATLAEQKAILSTPYWYRFLLVVRAAVVEEILFRGYIIEKVRGLSSSTALAVLVSVGAFTTAHLRGWGAAHLIAVAASGVVFALQYVWRRDMPSNMLGHFLSDAVGFLTR